MLMLTMAPSRPHQQHAGRGGDCDSRKVLGTGPRDFRESAACRLAARAPVRWGAAPPAVGGRAPRQGEGLYTPRATSEMEGDVVIPDAPPNFNRQGEAHSHSSPTPFLGNSFLLVLSLFFNRFGVA
jgi:hypothetical protein